MSIRIKLVILVCLMTILPAGLVGVLAYTLSQAALSEKVKGEFEARRELIQQALTNRLTELAKNADAWTTAPVMADIKIADNDMRIATFLLNTKKSYPIVRDVTILDSARKIIATTNQIYDDKMTPALKDIYPLETVAAGKAAAMIGVKAQQNFLAVPIHDVVSKDGTVVGLLLAEIDPKVIETLVHGANDGKDASEQVGVLLTTGGATIFTLAAGGVEVPYKSLAGSSNDVADGFTKVRVSDQDFVVMSGDIRDVLPGIGASLRLTVLQSASVAYAAVNRLAMYVFLVSTGMVVVFVTGGFLFARSLSRPILSLRDLSVDIIGSRDLSKRITIASHDEIGSLGTSFNHLLEMVQDSQGKLEEYSKGLEAKVNERTKAIRTVLDHVSFGLLICDAKLAIQPGYAKACLEIMECDGRKIESATLPELLRLDQRQAENFTVLYQQIFELDGGLAEFAAEQLPSRFQLGAKSLGVTGSVVLGDNGAATGVLFCLADITSLVRAEEQIERNRGLIKMLSNRDSFRHFAADVKAGFDSAYRACAQNDEKGLRHQLHTLKGTMPIYGLGSIGREIHLLEDEKVITEAGIKKVEDLLKTFFDEHRDLLGVAYGVPSDDSFVIPAKLVDDIQGRAEALGHSGELVDIFTEFFRKIRLKRARTVLGPIEDSFTQMAQKLGKQARLVFGGEATLVPAESVDVFKALSHLLRNALDHGIESSTARGGKDATGTVSLSVADDGAFLTIEVADDGRGISSRALADKAKASGLVTEARLAKMSEQEVYGLVFLEGVSTAKEITDISGRGIGMGAVKEAVEKAGGTIRIASRAGQGTTFTIVLPRVIRRSSAPHSQLAG